MADKTTTSADSKAQNDAKASDDEVGEQASDVATGNSPGSAQLEESDKKTEAVESSEESSQTSGAKSTSDEADTGPSDEEQNSDNEAEIKEWAAKKNLPLDDPIKLAKMYRESEQKLGPVNREKAELKTAVVDANSSAGVDDVQSLRNEVAALSFYIAHPEAKQFEQEMVSILDEKPWLAGDLEVVLDAAKGRTSTEAEKLVAERQAGKKEALETVAASERAAPPRASATTRETPKEITDADIGKMTPEEYNEWRKTNNPWAVSA